MRGDSGINNYRTCNGYVAIIYLATLFFKLVINLQFSGNCRDEWRK